MYPNSRRLLKFAAFTLLLVGLGVTNARPARAEQVKNQPVDESSQSESTDRLNSLNEKEQAFADALNGATLDGSWQMTRPALDGKGTKLTGPAPEKYTILRVEKVLEDQWIITARIQYANQDAEIPVPVRVVWAGDTPVITVDNLALPILGTYSARVMIYRGFYAGTWFGKGYGGILSGQIVQEDNEESDVGEDQPDADTGRNSE